MGKPGSGDTSRVTATPLQQERGKRALSWEGRGLEWGEHLWSCSLGNGDGFHPSQPFPQDLLGGHSFF